MAASTAWMSARYSSCALAAAAASGRSSSGTMRQGNRGFRPKSSEVHPSAAIRDRGLRSSALHALQALSSLDCVESPSPLDCVQAPSPLDRVQAPSPLDRVEEEP